MMQHGNWQWLAICQTAAKPVTRSVVFPFFQILLEKFLGGPTFSSSLNVGPRSAINFTTEIKRCRSDFQYCWHWLTLASSVSTLHCDYLHLRQNVIVASLCCVDCSRLLSVLQSQTKQNAKKHLRSPSFWSPGASARPHFCTPGFAIINRNFYYELLTIHWSSYHGSSA